VGVRVGIEVLRVVLGTVVEVLRHAYEVC
jgi:hypothetical protein